SLPYPFFVWREVFSKTTVDYFSSVVHGITDRQGNIFIVLITIWNSTNRHDFYMLCNAVHSNTIVSLCCNNPSNVCSVFRMFSITHYIVITIVSIFDVFRIITYDGSSVVIFVKMVI